MQGMNRRNRLGVRRRIALSYCTSILNLHVDEVEQSITWKCEAIFGQVSGFLATLVSGAGTGNDLFGAHAANLTLSVMAAIVCFLVSLTSHLLPSLSKSRKCTLNNIAIFSGFLCVYFLGVIVLHRQIGWLSYLCVSIVVLAFTAVNFVLRCARFKFRGEPCLPLSSNNHRVDSPQRTPRVELV